MNIRIFDKDVNLIAEVDAYQSLSFERKLFTSGVFKIKLNRGSKCAHEFKRNRLISVGNTGKKVGIIKQIQHNISNNDSMLEITGLELKGRFLQRVTIPTTASEFQSFTQKEAETIIKDVVTQNCVTNFPFSNLNVTVDQARGAKFDYTTRYKPLESEIERIARLSELGTSLQLNFATKKWDFDIIEGRDLTSTGGAINPVIFAYEYDNIQSQYYTESDFNSINYAIVGGSGDGVDRVIVETGTSDTDIDLYIGFVEAGNLSATDELTARGEETISKLKPIQSFNCDILPVSNYEYEVDYDLGDFVTLQDREIEVSVDKQIEGITEYYDKTGFKITVDFGQDLKTTRQIIDEKIDNSKVVS